MDSSGIFGLTKWEILNCFGMVKSFISIGPKKAIPLVFQYEVMVTIKVFFKRVNNNFITVLGSLWFKQVQLLCLLKEKYIPVPNVKQKNCNFTAAVVVKAIQNCIAHNNKN
jgi:hypothetical protein